MKGFLEKYDLQNPVTLSKNITNNAKNMTLN